MKDISSVSTSPAEARQNTVDTIKAIDVLQRLAYDVRTLSKASVFYRYLLGRHLMEIKDNELWRSAERRDYRKDPNGTPLWHNEDKRTYQSWYNFIEEGFEHITGLRRETAYSAMKLARSAALSRLHLKELQNFTRLANAFEVVAAERSGVTITPELILQAQTLPMELFRRTVRLTASSSSRLPDTSALGHIMKCLKAAAKTDVRVVNEFWLMVQQALTKMNQDPVRALDDILSNCSGISRKVVGREETTGQVMKANASIGQASVT